MEEYEDEHMIISMKGDGSSSGRSNSKQEAQARPRRGGGEQQTTTTTTTTSMMSWGTWEELLLACAVKRHGLNDWESVAMEVQAKTSLPQLLTTAYNCKLKYHDLQRRFSNHRHHQDDDDDPIPWLDDLKKLRLAQLRHDLHRYDVSIQ